MGYRLNRLDEPVFMAGPKPTQTEFGIHHRLESCEHLMRQTLSMFVKNSSTYASSLCPSVFGSVKSVTFLW